MKKNIIGIGIDVVELKRIERFLKSHQPRLKQFLNPSEYRLFQKSKSKVKCFATLFAAKEAASKALGQTIHSPKSFENFPIKFVRNRMHCITSKTKKAKSRVKVDFEPFESPGNLGVVAFARK